MPGFRRDPQEFDLCSFHYDPIRISRRVNDADPIDLMSNARFNCAQT